MRLNSENAILYSEQSFNHVNEVAIKTTRDETNIVIVAANKKIKNRKVVNKKVLFYPNHLSTV